MFHFLQAVRLRLVCKRVSVLRNQPHFGFNGSRLQDSALCSTLNKHEQHNKRTLYRHNACRFHSSRKKTENNSESYSSVDPHREEQFVFLDLVEPLNKNNPDPEELQITTRLQHKPSTNTDHKSKQRALRVQLSSLPELLDKDAHVDHIEFHDAGFSLERSGKKMRKNEHKIFGSPDAEIPISDKSCSGCGALMHCTAADLPGFIPSEKYKQLIQEEELTTAICQRCFLLTHHQKALSVTLPKEEYVKIVSRIKSEKALVLLIVDLLDLPDSILPNLPKLVGKNKRIIILGNKVDLLPGDSPNYLNRVKKQLSKYCQDGGIPTTHPKDVHLISAKTGYGIENLISHLQVTWKYKGNVYLVGTANAGKSTLFNTLLESDYCKSRASDVIQKATISPWPGTTLNLLKFPIINPTPHRLLRRAERLRQEALQVEEELDPEELKRIRHFCKQGYLIGRVGRTFRVQTGKKDLVKFDPDSLSFGEDLNQDNWGRPSSECEQEAELTYNELKDAHWFYDTPGIMKENNILSLLNEQEIKLVVPTHAIIPRTFMLKSGMVLFFGALARIDFLEGKHPCWFTVVASSQISVHITSLEKADDVYQKHAGDALLTVPTGGVERMKQFPPLKPQDFVLEGRGLDIARTDIKLSSAGWVAVTAAEGERIVLRCHAPVDVDISLRDPPLLPHIIHMKGPRIGKSPAYRTKKPQALLDSRRFAQKRGKKVINK